MASGRMAPSNAKSGRNVDPTLCPDSRLAFRRQVRQTHGTHGTQGIIFADELHSIILQWRYLDVPDLTFLSPSHPVFVLCDTLFEKNLGVEDCLVSLLTLI